MTVILGINDFHGGTYVCLLRIRLHRTVVARAKKYVRRPDSYGIARKTMDIFLGNGEDL